MDLFFCNSGFYEFSKKLVEQKKTCQVCHILRCSKAKVAPPPPLFQFIVRLSAIKIGGDHPSPTKLNCFYLVVSSTLNPTRLTFFLICRKFRKNNETHNLRCNLKVHKQNSRSFDGYILLSVFQAGNLFLMLFQIHTIYKSIFRKSYKQFPKRFPGKQIHLWSLLIITYYCIFFLRIFYIVY